MTANPERQPASAGAATADGPPTGDHRSVAARLRVEVDGGATLVLAVAVAAGPRLLAEHLEVTVDGTPVAAAAVEEVGGGAGGRLHVVRVPAGTVEVGYRATVGPAPGRAGPAASASPADLAVALRPSRYADSDRLGALARAEFGELAEPGPSLELAGAVTTWVGSRLAYVSGSSRGTDAASDALLAGAGVCRDFAHLVAGLLRALDVPTRVAGVYAPGLSPMDFHAVAEAWVDGAWHVLDATRLAPRQTLVRVATGRDTADTAFLSSTGSLRLLQTEVTAVLEQGPGERAFPADPGGGVVLG